MAILPTRFDVWFVKALASLLGRFPLFDQGVQTAVVHHVLGGFWYALVVYLLWLHGTAQRDDKVRLRMLATMVGSIVAVLLTVPASATIHWAPPILDPTLSHLYPSYIYSDSDPNSFPSRGATLYAAVTAGVFSLDRVRGSLLWLGIVFLVGLPRIYVGGHYPTDILAGIVLGLAGYGFARYILESRLLARLVPAIRKTGWLDGILEVFVFVWILQIATEFRDVIWIRNILAYFLKG
jgi:undecaprenyl-diphosphatase